MQVYNVQPHNNPTFSADLRIHDFDKILQGKGKFAHKSKDYGVRFFSAKELSEARKLFKEKTKDITGTLQLHVFNERFTTGDDYSEAKLIKYSPKPYSNKMGISVLNTLPPNEYVLYDGYIYQRADKPTFNRAKEVRKAYDMQAAIKEGAAEAEKHRLGEDSELVQKLHKLEKQSPVPYEEIREVSKQIFEEEQKSAEEAFKESLKSVKMRKITTVNQFVNRLVEVAKIMDKRGKRIDELWQLRGQVVKLQAKIAKEGNSEKINKQIENLEQKIDKIKFQTMVSDELAVGNICGSERVVDRDIPFFTINKINGYQAWGDYTYQDVIDFQSKAKGKNLDLVLTKEK